MSILIWQLSSCHAPRERVSWNPIFSFLVTKNSVTLHVSVWVEIYKGRGKHENNNVTLHVSVWVEICILSIFTCLIKSRSTWACELKSFRFNNVLNVTWSRSTWACELKSVPALTISPALCHAPRERVSWNVTALPFKIDACSHAPRERVSWNCNTFSTGV